MNINTLTSKKVAHSGKGKSGTPSSSRCVKMSACMSRFGAGCGKDKGSSSNPLASIFSVFTFFFTFFSPFSFGRAGFFLMADGGSTASPLSKDTASPPAVAKHNKDEHCIEVKADRCLSKHQTQCSQEIMCFTVCLKQVQIKVISILPTWPLKKRIKQTINCRILKRYFFYSIDTKDYIPHMVLLQNLRLYPAQTA